MSKDLPEQPALNVHIPEFSTILWDSFETITISSGKVIGFIPAVAGGLMAGAFNLMCPCDQLSFSESWNIGFYGVGSGVGCIGGGLLATAFSLPLTGVAYYTREFKPNWEIEAVLNKMNAFKLEYLQKAIVEDIISQYNRDSWGFRSLASTELLTLLGDPDITQKVKWQSLTAYVKKQSASGAYIHNGKKLHTTVLNVVNRMDNIIYSAIRDDSIEPIKSWLSNLENTACNFQMVLGYLRYAIVNKKINAFICLVNWHKNLANDKSYENKTALDLATETGDIEIIKYLLRNEAQSTIHPIQSAIRCGHLKMVNLLVNAIPKIVFIDHLTLLRYAIYCNKPNIVKFLAGLVNKDELAIALKDARKYSLDNIVNELIDSGAIDAEYLHLTREFKSLLPIIYDKNWLHQGFGLFANHTPRRVLELQTYLQAKKIIQADDIDGLDAATVKKIIKHMQAIVREQSLFNLKPSVLSNQLYQKISQLTGHSLVKIKHNEQGVSKFNNLMAVGC